MKPQQQVYKDTVLIPAGDEPLADKSGRFICQLRTLFSECVFVFSGGKIKESMNGERK